MQQQRKDIDKDKCEGENPEDGLGNEHYAGYGGFGHSDAVSNQTDPAADREESISDMAFDYEDPLAKNFLA